MNKCPVCKQNDLLEEGANALSRKDNQTEICSDCGRKEAMEEFRKFEMGLLQKSMERAINNNDYEKQARLAREMLEL